MFAGHYGAGLGAKAADARVPPWVLFLAVQWLDVVWSILVLANVEKVRVVQGLTDASDFDFHFYRYSHSLTAAVVWSAAAALALVLVVTGYSTVFGDSTDRRRRRPRPLAARHAAPAPSAAMGR
jgi:hypothetical protein